MSRRLAFARARWPVAVAMRVVAAAQAEAGPRPDARRGVLTGPRNARRRVSREPAIAPVETLSRGCEGLH